MRLGKLHMVALAALVGLLMSQLAQRANADAMVKVYYFPEQTVCTLIVDFERRRDELEALDADARSLELAKTMVGEFSANGGQQCNSAPTVRMMATYIVGVDTYGRPNFASRVNLLLLEGQAEHAQSPEAIDPQYLADNFSVETY